MARRQNTSQAGQTWLMDLQEESSDQSAFYSLKPIFPLSSKISLSMQHSHSLPQSFVSSVMGSTPLLLPNSLTAHSYANKPLNVPEQPAQKKTRLSSMPLPTSTNAQCSRFSAPLPPSSQPAPSPQPYIPGLTPLPSPLRPHCLTRERLRKWIPPGTSTRLVSASSTEVSISEDQVIAS